MMMMMMMITVVMGNYNWLKKKANTMHSAK